MANGGIIGPANDPVQLKNVTTFTSSAPGGHTFNPATTGIDYLIVAGSGGKNPSGIGNSGTGAGGLKVSESSYATPVTPAGTTGAITVGAAGGIGSQGGSSSIASGGGIPSTISTTGGGQGVARGGSGAPGGSGSGGGDGYPSNTTSAGSGTGSEGNPGGPGGPGEPSGAGGGYTAAGGADYNPQYGPGDGYSSDIESPASAPVSLVYAIGGNGEGAPGGAPFGNNPHWPGGSANGTGRANSGMGTLYGDASAGIVVISENGGGGVSASGVWTLQEQFTEKKSGVWT